MLGTALIAQSPSKGHGPFEQLRPDGDMPDATARSAWCVKFGPNAAGEAAPPSPTRRPLPPKADRSRALERALPIRAHPIPDLACCTCVVVHAHHTRAGNGVAYRVRPSVRSSVTRGGRGPGSNVARFAPPLVAASAVAVPDTVEAAWDEACLFLFSFRDEGQA